MELHRIIEEGSDSDFKWICLHPTVIIQRGKVSLDGFPTFTAISHLYSGKEKKFSTFCNSRRWFRVKTMTNVTMTVPHLSRNIKRTENCFPYIVAPTDDCRVAVGVFVHGFSRVRGYL